MYKTVHYFSALVLCFALSGSLSAQTDDCTDPTDLTDGLTETWNSSGGTLDEDFSSDTGCDPAVYDESVWFEITPTLSGSLIFEFESNGTDPTGDFSIVVTDETDCTTALGSFCGDWTTDIVDEQLQVYCTAIAGNVYYIQISTETGNGGDFDLTVTSMGNDANDLCAMASPSGTVDCDTQVSGGPVSIGLACPDMEADCLTDAETEPAVWFSFTVDAAVPSFTFTGTDVELFEGADCGSITSLGCPTLNNVTADPAMTYYVLALDGASWTANPDYTTQPSDDCANAMTIGAGSTAAYTFCASNDHDECGGTTTDTDAQTVWFEYTVNAAVNANLTISVSATGNIPMTDLSIVVFEDCAGTIYDDGDADLTDTEDCSAGFDSDHVIDCIPDGTTLLIAVGSSEAGAGDFEINISQENTTTNDVCDGAIDLMELGCGDEFTGGFVGPACPDDDVLGAACAMGQDGEWYTFTAADNLVSFSITGSNFEFLQGDCATTTFGTFSCGPIANQMVDPTLTYWIVVFDGGDFTVTADQDVPTNDECDDAIAVGAGMNNYCASTDFVVTGCSNAQSEATVWFSYNIAAPIDQITIEVTGSGADPITNFGFAVYDVNGGCGGPINVDNSCDSGNPLVIDCPPVGDLAIQVGSAFVDMGEFDISVTEGNATPINDICDNATDEGTLPECVAQNITGNNTNSCPENFTLAGCNIDVDPTVWHEVSVPAGAVALEIENVTGGAIITIWDDCPTGGTAWAPVCITSDETVNIPSGGTYYISVGTTPGNEGPYSFDITAIVPPANDLCDDADTATAGVTAGTNVCATTDVTLPCQAGNVDVITVWYEYIVPAGVKQVTISVAGTGGTPLMGDIYMGAFEDCAFNLLPGESSTCAGADLIIPCPDEGSSIFISIGSEDANAGDFELTILEESPNCVYTNDECADAVALPTDPETNMGEECVDGCNELACPDAAMDAACGGEVYNVVWFQFTTDGFDDAIETFLQATVNNATDFNPVVQIFDACGGAPIGPCATTTTGPISNNDFPNIDPNTTYWVAVGNDDITQSGGDFELCVEVTQGCANDECEDAIVVVDGVTISTTLLNCTPDIALGECTPQQDDPSAWYTYVVPAGVTAFEVEVSSGSGDLSMIWALNTNCANPEGDLLGWMDAICDATEGGLETCVQEGQEFTFYFFGGFPGDDFDLTITGLEPDHPDNPSPDNDLCDGAFDVPLNDQCEPECVTVDNEFACPESFAAGGGCNTDQDATVWFSVTLPAMAVALEFSDISNGMHISVYENNCAGLPLVECVSDGDADLLIDNLAPGGTYLIAAGSMQQLPDHQFCVTAVVPPENDTPCPTSDFPPIDLTGGGNYSGTTCCAIGFNDGGADFQNQECGGASDDNSVWFIYQATGASDAISIGVSAPAAGSWTLEVYEIADPNDPCGNFTYTDIWSICDITADAINIGCPDPEIYYLIKLTSNDEDCGDYTIGVQEIDSPCSDMADLCDETSVVLAPVTDPNFNINYVCADGCLQYACPEEQGTPPGQPCIFNDNPTVWMSFSTDDEAAQIFTTVTTDGSWQPVWSIYGGTSCNDLVQIGGGMGGAPPCSNGDTTPDLHQVAAEDAFDMYWVAISADGEVDNPNFEFCVATTINAIICLGDINDNCEAEANFEVTDRGNDGPLEGPFCPGEEVTVCIDFTYDASETGADWLIGIVPTFGPGWDLDEFDPSMEGPTGGNWDWHEEGSGCAAILQEPLPHMCTFTNDQGMLELCNGLCDACPCTLGMQPGDELPSGWFTTTNGSNAGCVAGSCMPGQQWGIGTNVATVSFCMDLVVKTFVDEEECLENNDLQITFQSFSDGVAGCWEDPVGECLIDRPQVGPVWEVDCNVSPPAEAEPMQVCSGDPADVEVTIEGGLDGEIIIEISDETSPDIEGQSEHNFTGGVGTIDDILENCGTEIEFAEYVAYAIVDGFICPGPPDTIQVPVIPKFQFDAEPQEVCLPFTLTLNANDIIISGGEAPFSYQWFENGVDFISDQVTMTLELSLNTSFILLTVEDVNGCTDEVEIPITVFAMLEPVLTIEEEQACPDDPGTVCAIVELGLGEADDYNWIVINEAGDEVVLDNTANDEYCIDTGDAPPGVYTITVEVFNDAGCEGISNPVTFTMHAEPGGIVVPQAGGSCDDEVVICIDFYGDDPDDDIYENGPDANMDGIPDIFDVDGDGVPDFQDVVWDTPNGLFDTGELCFTATVEGFYAAQIITAANCYGEIIGIDVELPAPMAPVITDPGPQCEGDVFPLEAIPNDMANMYNWTVTSSGASLGTTNPITVTAMTTETYAVEMTDAQGCVTTASITVEVNPNPVINLSGALEVCAGLMTTLNAGGDPDNWSYSWIELPGGTEVGTTQEVTIAPGDYEVTVIDTNFCTATLPFSVTEEDMISVSVGGADICDNGSAILSAVGAFDTWEWLDPNNVVIGDMDSIEVTMAGTYTVNITVSGCDGSGTYTVNQVDSPTSPVPPTASACNIDSGQGPTSLNFNDFTAGGSTGNWVSLDPNIDISDLTDVSFLGQAAGMYTFEFTTNTAVAPCEDVTYTMVVTVDDCSCPNADVLDPDPLCSDDDMLDLTTLYFATTDPGSWSIISGPGGATITGTIFDATGATAGDYELEFMVDDPVFGGNCVNADTVILTVNDPPVITFDVVPTMCDVMSQIGPTLLDLNGLITSGTGIWQDPMIPGALFNAVAGTIDFDGVTPGQYTISIMSTNAVAPCPNGMFSIVVEVIDCNCPDQPLFISPPILCNVAGEGVDLNTLFDGTVYDGTWVLIDQPPMSNVTLNGSMFDAVSIVEGNYVVQFTLSDDPGEDCEDTFVLDPITVVNQPNAGTDGLQSVCLDEDETFDLNDILTDEDLGGAWTEISIDMSTGGAFDAAAGTFNSMGQQDGVYTFQYEIVPEPPCDAVAAVVEIFIEGLPDADAGSANPLTCDNTSVMIGNPAGTEQGMGIEYSWTESNDPSTVLGTDIQISVSQAGTYTLEVLDQNTGCISTSEIIVLADQDLPSYSLESADIPCFGLSNGSINFVNVSGGDGNYQFSIDGGVTYGTSAVFNNLGPGTYDVFLLDGNGCEIPDQVTITEPELLTVSAGDDAQIVQNIPNELMFTTNVPLDQITNVTWMDSDGNIVCEGSVEDCELIMVSPETSTTYTVTITTENGCIATDNVRLNLSVVMDCFVPNIFNPETATNSANTAFFMWCDEFAEQINSFYVFDRWGELVFSAENIQPNDPNQGWDGRLNGKAVEAGVYVYVIEVKFIDEDDPVVYAGDITVIK